MLKGRRNITLRLRTLSRRAACIIAAGQPSANNYKERGQWKDSRRHRARTTVYLLLPGRKRRLCKARNLSASGVFVETCDLGLRKGQTVELAFAISLGVVTKLHRRTAVVRISRGRTG
jgi:hypothetical protein